MLSPLATPDVAARSAPAHGERELKFTLSEGRVDLARRWLERVCRRDPTFPGSDRLDDLLRYAGVGFSRRENQQRLPEAKDSRAMVFRTSPGRATGPAFVEAKLRVGNRRSKVRARLPYPAEELARWDLQDARLPHVSDAPERARNSCPRSVAAGHADSLSSRSLHRTVEQSRISLDSDIAAAAVNRTLHVGD